MAYNIDPDTLLENIRNFAQKNEISLQEAIAIYQITACKDVEGSILNFRDHLTESVGYLSTTVRNVVGEQ